MFVHDGPVWFQIMGKERNGEVHGIKTPDTPRMSQGRGAHYSEGACTCLLAIPCVVAVIMGCSVVILNALGRVNYYTIEVGCIP